MQKLVKESIKTKNLIRRHHKKTTLQDLIEISESFPYYAGIAEGQSELDVNNIMDRLI